jgi:hypothetical protein
MAKASAGRPHPMQPPPPPRPVDVPTSAPPPFPGHWAPSRHRSTADIVVTSVLLALQLPACLVAFWLSAFFAMADCRTECNTVYADLIYPVTWGGIAVSLLLASVGVILAAVRRSIMWVWPALGLVIVVGSFIAGAALTEAASR